MTASSDTLTRAELLAFIEDAHARGLTHDQVTDDLIAHGFTIKQIVDALLWGGVAAGKLWATSSC
jgi:hypothetical protein